MKLFATANAMNVFFNYVPAKKNKGLILQVIPRLIEGWKVKYITGSGQTIATRDRVHIYETEGHIKPFHRGKDRNKQNTTKGATDPTAAKPKEHPQQPHPKKRQLPAEYRMSNEEIQRAYHQRLSYAPENNNFVDPRQLSSCSWGDSIVALARSYSLSENSDTNNNNILAVATSSLMPPRPDMQLPSRFAMTNCTGQTFEEQQEALKRQICSQQNATVERVPSFDSAFPPILNTISREVSWDKDLNGPGDNSVFHPNNSMKPVVNHCLWF